MKLLVDAPVSAALLRTDRGVGSLAEGYPETDIIAAALIVRQRFRLEGSELRLEAPVSPEDHLRYETIDKGEYGQIRPDDIAPRTGTDVILIGDAVVNEPAIAAHVGVKVGPYEVNLDIFGDRVWEGSLGALVPSAPAPFTRMPLTYARAYGGSAPTEYGALAWYRNPVGRGYFLRAADAKGGSLPNIEGRPHIRAWDDRPDPQGVAPYPVQWGLRWEKFVEVLPEEEQIEIHPDRGMFDRAHPALSGERVEPGPMFVVGMTERALRFDVPECPVEALISIAGAESARSLDLEEILVDLRESYVELTWRTMFRYPLYANQAREARVVPRRR